MKLANFTSGQARQVGVVEEGRIVPLQKFSQLPPAVRRATTLDEILREGLLPDLSRAAASTSSAGGIPLSGVKLGSPVFFPGKIFLAAVNYRAHGKEQDAKPPSSPYFFTKFGNTVVGDGDPILVPRNSKKVDWEVELAVIIGRKGKYVSKAKAMDHVAGYCVSNDVSFRDLQFPPGWPKKLNPLGQNWVLGKGLDNSLPLGPWMVTADELDDLGDLKLKLKVNGVVKQDASTSDMIFSVPELISYLSAGLTLMPGDVISTGTPMGVAVFSGEPYLKPGDYVEASVAGIGTLHNPVKAGA